MKQNCLEVYLISLYLAIVEILINKANTGNEPENYPSTGRNIQNIQGSHRPSDAHASFVTAFTRDKDKHTRTYTHTRSNL